MHGRASDGFPKGAHRPGSTVTWEWRLRCTGTSVPVDVVVDPFGGLLAPKDTSYRITLD